MFLPCPYSPFALAQGEGLLPHGCKLNNFNRWCSACTSHVHSTALAVQSTISPDALAGAVEFCAPDTEGRVPIEQYRKKYVFRLELEAQVAF